MALAQEARRIDFPCPPSKQKDRIHILSRREGGDIEALVPLSQISGLRSLPVDELYARKLAASIAAESKTHPDIRNGQLPPVLLVRIPDCPQLIMIDGASRLAALGVLGRQEVIATVKSVKTWDEVTDLRIINATTHPSVRFARLTQLIEQAWKNSPWGGAIEASQAFSLSLPSLAQSEALGFDPDEIKAIRKWTATKTIKWHIPGKEICDLTKTAEAIDPELLAQVREYGGHKRHLIEEITPSHIQVMMDALPGKYELQTLLISVAKEYALFPSTVGEFAILISNASSVEEARTLIQESVNQSFDQEVRILQTMIKAGIQDGTYIPESQTFTPKYVSRRSVIHPQDIDTNLTPPSPAELQELVEKISSLRLRIRSYAVNVLGTQQLADAEDIVSEATIRAIKCAKRGILNPEYLATHSLESFMTRLAKFSWVDAQRTHHGRKDDRAQTSHPTEVLISAIETEPDSDEPRNGGNYATLKYYDPGFVEIEDEDEATRFREHLRFALMQTGEVRRRVIILRVFFDLPSEDVAQILKKRRGNVDSVYAQVKDELATILNPEPRTQTGMTDLQPDWDFIMAQPTDETPRIRIASVEEPILTRRESPEERYIRLTPTERLVLESLLDLSLKGNKGIAQNLKMAERTVTNHLHHIYRKLDVPDRTQAAIFELVRQKKARL
jgi:RNA polymerase sigma factor (sigma-70 family)